MDLLGIIAACSLYADHQLVHAIARVHSRGLVHFVAEAQARVMPAYAPSLSSGRDALQRMQAAGGRPLVGLLSVPLEWAKAAGQAPDALFDACTNVRLGTGMLKRFDAECRQAAPAAAAEQLRACVAGRYGQAIRLPELAHAVATSLEYHRRRAPAHPYPAASAGDADDDFAMDTSGMGDSDDVELQGQEE